MEQPHSTDESFSLRDILSLQEMKKARLSQASQRQLALDLFILSKGGRAGLMIDYCLIPSQSLLQILNGATRVTRTSYLVLSWDNGSCFLVIRPDEALDHLRSIADGKRRVMMVEFIALGPEWKDPRSVVEALTPSLKLLINAIAPHTAPQPLAARIISTPVIQFESLKQSLLMPTLNGLLLGYPVLYYVESVEESLKAARDLSSEPLTLFRCTSGGDQTQIISSFSVPTRLLPEVKDDIFWDCIRSWSDKLIRAAEEVALFEQKNVGIVSVSL